MAIDAIKFCSYVTIIHFRSAEKAYVPSLQAKMWRRRREMGADEPIVLSMECREYYAAEK